MLRTKSQRKTIAGHCPVAKVADLFGDSCSLLIIRDLLEEPHRFCELEKSLKGISTRTLSNKLKRLEHEKMILRKKVAKEQHIEYVLTKKGSAFNTVVDAMRTYGKKYL